MKTLQNVIFEQVVVQRCSKHICHWLPGCLFGQVEALKTSGFTHGNTWLSRPPPFSGNQGPSSGHTWLGQLCCKNCSDLHNCGT